MKSVVSRLSDFAYKAYMTVCVTLITLVVCGVCFGYGISTFMVSGKSMEPTIGNGQIIVAYHYPGQKYKPGDIVSVTNKYGALDEITSNKNEAVLKRVIAVEGDTVRVEKGYIYVNGVQDTSFPYRPNDYYSMTEFEVTLKEGEYFVAGDNRNHSIDSRAFGVVTEKDIDNKLFIVF